MRNPIVPSIFAGALLSITLFSQAQPPLVFQQTLAIGGVELITLRGETKEAVAVRADVIYARLIWILADSSLAPRDVWIDFTKTDPSIYVKNRLLITVVPSDSKYNQSNPGKQAEIWRKRFSQTLPILKSADPPTNP